MTPGSCLRALGFVLALTLAGTSCKSSDDGGAGGCGLKVDGKEYELILACDAPVAASITDARLCTEYYSNVRQAVEGSVKAICDAFKGKSLDVCPTQGSLGSCTNSSMAGGGQGLISVTYSYAESGQTEQQSRNNCSGIYAPPGAPPASTPSAGASVTSTCEAPSETASGAVAFSVSTLANGEVINCSNYIGEVSAAQLDSVLSIGATRGACPEANAGCACLTPGAGTFGTDLMQVHYDTSMTSEAESDCASVEMSCTGEFTQPYRAP